MAHGFPIQTNFTSGEISPLLYGRVDFNKYFNGARSLINVIPKPQGGVLKRSGTRFVAEVKDSTKKTRLLKFEFSNVQAYALEFGENYIRIYRNGGRVESPPGTPVEVATTYAEAELFDLRITQSADVLYIVHPSHKPATLSRTSHTSWTLADIEFSDGPYQDFDESNTLLKVTSNQGRATLRSTDYTFTGADVNKWFEVTYNGQKIIASVYSFTDADNVVIRLFSNMIDSRNVDRTSLHWCDALRFYSSVYQFSKEHEYSFIYSKNFTGPVNGWYLLGQFEPTTYSIANPTGSGGSPNPLSAQFFNINLATFNGYAITQPMTIVNAGTADHFEVHDPVIYVDIEASDDTFAATDVGRLIRLTLGNKPLWVRIVTYTDATHVAGETTQFVPREFDDPSRHALPGLSIANDGETDVWRWGSWNDENYPAVVAFHENRLAFASSPSFPQTLWMSKSGDYYNFAPTDEDSVVLDDNGITYAFASREVNKITWIASSGTFVIGTQGEEWIVRATSLQDAITPANINFHTQTPFGSKDTTPILIGNSIIFLQRSGNVLRDYFYDFSSDRFNGKDISILSEHILRQKNGAVEMAFQQEPSKLIWFATGDGSLVSLTFEKDQDIYAWANHQLGGADVEVESIVAIPSSDNSYDQVYMIVKRTIDGGIKRYVEILEQEFDSADPVDQFFVDSGLSYSGSATNTVTGLDHLEGETVKIMADGTVRGDQTVTSGAITFNGDAATVVHVGLSFMPVVGILPLEAGASSGTAQGKTKRIYGVTVRVNKTVELKYGPSLAKLSDANLKDLNIPLDSAPVLRSGDKFLEFDGDFELLPELYITQSEPVAFNLLMIAPKVRTSDR